MDDRRIAILGGTFNPVHNGHIALAKGFAALLGLQRVLLMITNVPPHKRAPDLASAQDRLAMCRLAESEEPLLSACALELRRPGKSYTWETLTQVRERFPSAELYFITGADMFLTLEQWKHPERIFSLCTVCAAPRGEDSAAELRKYAAHLQARGARAVVADFVPPNISSTQIRVLAAERKNLHGWVPESVEQYILQRGLYCPTAPQEKRNPDDL